MGKTEKMLEIYAERKEQEARQEGRQEGELRGKVLTIEGFLGRDVPWSIIEAATGVDQASATEVAVSVGGGSATSGTDYTAVADFTLTIAATESTGTGTFTLTPTQDSVSEGDETIDVTGSAGDITVTKAEMTLTDDETAPGTITLTTDPTSVGEDASETEVRVTATLGGSVTLSSATEVTVSVGGGTATSGTDYTAVADITLTIAATESTGTGTFMLTPTQDSVSEGDETIDITGTAGDFTVTKAEMTLTDDETAPGTIALTTDPTSVGEDASETEVTVIATLGGSVTLAGATEVTVSVGGGTATSGTDYTAVADITLTIAATESTGTGTFMLTPSQDSVSEGDETIDVTGVATDFTVTKATMTLTDDETAPTAITLTTDPTSVREDASETEVTVTATLGGSVTLAGATEVTVSVGGGTATSGTDYTAVADFTLTIAATESTGTGTFMLTPSQDSVSEGDETIDITGSAGDITVTKAEMTLTDDETAPTAITLTTDPTSVGEDASETEVTVIATLGGSVTLAGATEVTVSVGGGSATSGTDYTAVDSFTLTIAATESTGTGTFTLTPTQDSASEGDETIDITGTAGDFTVTPAEMTLTDDETAPTAITLTTDPTSVREDASETEVTVIATLGGSVTLAGATEVTVSVGGGTATSGTDYTAVADITLTIAATESTGTGTFMLTPTQDSVSEGDETIDITGTAGDFTVTKAEMTLTDDPPDEDPPALTIADVRAVESAGQMAFTVQLAAASGRLVTVDYATVSGTATEGIDYTGKTGTLTFRPGGALTRTIAVPIVDDALDEVDETFRMRLSGARHATLAGGGATLAATGTILDDDEPAVSIVADAAAVQEGQAARFTVTRTGHATEPLTVTVEVTETGSVIAGTVPVRVSFEANVRTATLVVATEDDTIDEPDGAVTAAIVAGGGYVTMDPASATVTISDNDAAPALTIADARVLESAGEIEFTVRMAAASGHRVTVACVSEDGTALADQDYEGEVGILALEPGQTVGKIRVAVLDDTLDEMDETFTMVLSDPAHATLTDATATGTIEDDDGSVAQAWLSRFGRTVATHVMDAVGGRLAEGAGQGSQASVAGRRLEPAADVAPSEWFEPASFRTMEFRELLAGSSFDLTALREDESAAASGWTAWGRGGATRLAGKEDGLSVGGTVAGGVVGADYEWGRMLAGLSAAYSGGGGEFTVRGTGAARDRTGDVGSWLVSAHPYVRVQVSDRLSAWALAGYGVGRLSLDEEARELDTGIAMAMGAFGARGVLLSPEQHGGLSLAMKSDGFLLRIDSQAADELPAAAAEVQRVRLVLDGSVDVLRGPGGVLTPSLQVGGRYDGGDAETGVGLEVGGGLRYSYPEWGLTVQANGRLLLSHEDRDYEEWGAGGSIRIAPGSQGRGLSVGLNTSWGPVASGVERLWSTGAPRLAGGAAADDAAGPPGRLEAELGYGIDALGGGSLLTPYAGLTLGDGGDTIYRLGGRLDIGSFSLGLQADRNQSAGALPEHELRLTGTVRW